MKHPKSTIPDLRNIVHDATINKKICGDIVTMANGRVVSVISAPVGVGGHAEPSEPFTMPKIRELKEE